MRKRWQFDPWPYVIFWFMAGLVMFIVSVALWHGCNDPHCSKTSLDPQPPMHLSTASVIALCLWLGPLVISFVMVVVIDGAKAMWEGRPHRVIDPITTDLRESEDD